MRKVLLLLSSLFPPVADSAVTQLALAQGYEGANFGLEHLQKNSTTEIKPSYCF
ncbi:hypothetical protein [Pseudomonas sp. B11(2017)]|uniref:hypothetical protein n=1 Tax=Pseudomonas sp. B11(2017) TaxID=1981748 RepID=UPI001593C6F8|nr:hypothetical protein [Pseudomonas sp. B11(2017)]